MDTFTVDDIKALNEKLKPKKMVITPDKKLYEQLLQMPEFNKDNVKLSKWVEKTMVVDLNKINGCY